jgi:hypothetical protein
VLDDGVLLGAGRVLQEDVNHQIVASEQVVALAVHGNRLWRVSERSIVV